MTLAQKINWQIKDDESGHTIDDYLFTVLSHPDESIDNGQQSDNDGQWTLYVMNARQVDDITLNVEAQKSLEIFPTTC